MVSLIFSVVFPFFPVFHFNLQCFLLYYHFAALWVPLGPSWWVCILMCVYGLQITRKIQELTKANTVVWLFMFYCASWISCQSDFSPNEISSLRVAETSIFLIHLPLRLLTVPINNKGIGFFHILLPIKSAPIHLQSCCIQGLPHGTELLCWLNWQKEGVVLRLTLSTFTCFYLNTEIIY